MYEPLRTIIIEEPRNYHSEVGLCPKTTLEHVYQQGWWITEIFGSYVVLVKISESKTRKAKYPYFICVQSRIDTKQITPKAQKIITKTQNQKWKKYGNYLLGGKNERKI